MNVAEILKNAPKGTKLYSPLFGIVTYCYWSYVVPIDKFNFEDMHSNILNALQ